MWQTLMFVAWLAQADTLTPKIEHALVAQGGDPKVAPRVAAAIVRYAERLHLDPELLVAVVWIENRELRPRAVSTAGATGIFQVMPAWRADILHCGRDLENIETNVCFGATILRWYLDGAPSVRTALLHYSGCVRAPGCERYADLVLARLP